MRKIIKYVVIPLIIIILILGSLLYFKYNKKDKDNDNEIIKTLSGTKIKDNIYGYKLKEDIESSIVFSILYKDYIYYGLSNKENISFYRYNIYNNENKLIKESFGYMGCNISNDKLYCFDNSKTDMLDLNLNIIKSNIGSNIVPIKDTYYVIKENDLYDNENIIYKFDNSKYKNYEYYDYEIINNEIYLYYFDYDNNKYIVCDITNNKCTNIPSNRYTKYNNGIYFVNKDNVELYDLTTDKQSKYNLSINRSESYTNYLLKDNLYFYNMNLQRLEIINYKENSIDYIDMKSISTFDYYNNYLYIYTYNGDYDYYIIDINSYKFNYISSEEYIKSFDDILNNKIKEIKDKYNVNIHVKDDIISFPDFTYKKYDDTIHIISSLNEITTVLDKLSKEVFDSFYDKDYKGLHMYLTGELKPKDMKTQYSSPAAYSLTYKNQYIITMNIGIFANETNTCHELMHNIENNLNNKGEYFSDWYKLNPKKHTYTYSYKDTNNNKYTIGESNINNVYFVDSYANTYPAEDMARIFENICNTNESSILNTYPKLYKKGIYLRDTLYKYYPSLKETTLFNSLKIS